MTLAQIAALPRETLTPGQVAEVLCVDPQWVRTSAHKHPDYIPFPIIVRGTRTLIPKRPFLEYMGYTEEAEKNDA